MQRHVLNCKPSNACTHLSNICRRQKRVRADSYHAARLLGLGLTAWASHWAEGAELRQKGAVLKETR